MANPIEEVNDVVLLGVLIAIAFLGAWGIGELLKLFGSPSTPKPYQPDQPAGSYTGAGQKLGENLPAADYNNPFTYPWGDLWTNLKNVWNYGFVPATPSTPRTRQADGSDLNDYNPNLEPGDIPAISQAFLNWS
jgi:hypothetical protein